MEFSRSTMLAASSVIPHLRPASCSAVQTRTAVSFIAGVDPEDVQVSGGVGFGGHELGTAFSQVPAIARLFPFFPNLCR